MNSRIERMESLGVAIGSEQRVASLSDQQFEFDIKVAKKFASESEPRRLDNIMQAMLKHGESLMEPMPWWAGEFAHRWNQLQASMRSFVREGEHA